MSKDILHSVPFAGLSLACSGEIQDENHPLTICSARIAATKQRLFYSKDVVKN